MTEENQKEEENELQAEEPSPGSKPPRSRWFGRGIYQSKDVPIRLLDGLIAVIIIVILLLTATFAIRGGYLVSFDTGGGSEVPSQKLRHGNLVAAPEEPNKAGYEFRGWHQENEPEKAWDFNVDKIGGDLKLTAEWIPAKITVKFDLDGGRCGGRDTIDSIQLAYQAKYGALPVPEKSGAVFKGWMYSGEFIRPNTVVAMTGEHVLTAVWE